MVMNKKVLLFMLTFFCTNTLAKTDLDVLKPCLEYLAQSPNDLLTPTPRGNSEWFGSYAKINTASGPVNYTFNTLVFTKIRTNQSSPDHSSTPPTFENSVYEFHTLQINPKGEITIRRFSASAKSVLQNKGVIIPIGASCEKSLVGEVFAQGINGCTKMNLALDVGIYPTTHYNLATQKIENGQVINQQLIWDNKAVQKIADGQMSSDFKEEGAMNKEETLGFVFADIAQHLTYIQDRPQYTKDEAGKNLILATIKSCKDSYLELLTRDISRTKARASLFLIADALDKVDITKKGPTPRSAGTQ
jgi:hypothetical protein